MTTQRDPGSPSTGDRTEVGRLLEEQMRYYEERAPEYEDLWFRQGRHDLGPEVAQKWFAETAALEAAADGFCARGRVLELAAGSGLWTERLVRTADSVVAVDASPAMLERNRARVEHDGVTYEIADLFAGWEPAERFDAIVFGFFISHIPPDLFDDFFARLRTWLAPGGRVWFCDDLQRRPFTGEGKAGEDAPDFVRSRDLADGRTFTIVKVFFEPEELQARLASLGWEAEVQATGEFFFAGTAVPVDAPGRGNSG